MKSLIYPNCRIVCNRVKILLIWQFVVFSLTLNHLQDTENKAGLSSRCKTKELKLFLTCWPVTSSAWVTCWHTWSLPRPEEDCKEKKKSYKVPPCVCSNFTSCVQWHLVWSTGPVTWIHCPAETDQQVSDLCTGWSNRNIILSAVSRVSLSLSTSCCFEQTNENAPVTNRWYYHWLSDAGDAHKNTKHKWKCLNKEIIHEFVLMNQNLCCKYCKNT